MDKLSELNQLKLTGRIYPAIKSCVNNRYKIMLALFVYYNFAFSSDVILKIRTGIPLDSVMSVILIIFTFQNLTNYYFNANELIKIEQNIDKVGIWDTIKASKIEIFFDITAILSIMLAFQFLSI